MKLPNLLFISIAFPPKSDPECIQTGRYYRALSKTNNFKIQVLTSSSPTLFMKEDVDLNKYIPAKNNIIKIKINEWKITNWLLRKVLPDGIDWPDSKFSFYKKWKQTTKMLNTPDVIYSRSFPLSSTLMGYKLSTYFNVPWVLHLSDPWSISPIHTRSKKNQIYQNKWERKCFKQASTICLTSKATVKAYQQLYPALKDKFHFIPNVSYEGAKKRKFYWGRKLRIIYTGGLTAMRSPKLFLTALENLIGSNPEIEACIEVIFAGNFDREVRENFKRTSLKCIQHIGNLSLNKSIDLQQSGHVLLSIDNPINNEKEAMFIPSKIYDYINSGRKVLAITTPNSSTATFLNNYNAEIIAFNDIKKIEITLLNCVKAFEAKDEKFFIQAKQLPKELSVTYNAHKIINLLTQAMISNG